MNKFFIIILFLFLSLNKSEGQGIEINSFEEISLKSLDKTPIFKPRIGFGGNYLINNNIKIGGAYQHFDDNYVNESMGSNGYSISHYTHSIRDIYEINITLMKKPKNEKISSGFGIKPGIQYHLGESYIISKTNSLVGTTKYDTVKISKVRLYNSGFFYTRFNNILNTNFSFEINFQLGAVLAGIYPNTLYGSPFQLFSPFTRFNAGLIYKFKNKDKKTL